MLCDEPFIRLIDHFYDLAHDLNEKGLANILLNPFFVQIMDCAPQAFLTPKDRKEDFLPA